MKMNFFCFEIKNHDECKYGKMLTYKTIVN